jgi:hypothetical protein
MPGTTRSESDRKTVGLELLVQEDAHERPEDDLEDD